MIDENFVENTIYVICIEDKTNKLKAFNLELKWYITALRAVIDLVPRVFRQEGVVERPWGQGWAVIMIYYPCSIDHFTVVCIVAWPLNESEAGVDLVLIETLLLFIC